jgi:hypothetical protein
MATTKELEVAVDLYMELRKYSRFNYGKLTQDPGYFLSNSDHMHELRIIYASLGKTLDDYNTYLDNPFGYYIRYIISLGDKYKI